MLSKLDGFEVLRHVPKIQRSRFPRLIVVSAASATNRQKFSISALANICRSRPFESIVVKSPGCRKVSLLASIKSHSVAVIRLHGSEPLLTLRRANLLTPGLDLLTLPIGKFPAQFRKLQ
jgi:hypothetical protein